MQQSTEVCSLPTEIDRLAEEILHLSRSSRAPRHRSLSSGENYAGEPSSLDLRSRSASRGSRRDMELNSLGVATPTNRSFSIDADLDSYCEGARSSGLIDSRPLTHRYHGNCRVRLHDRWWCVRNGASEGASCDRGRRNLVKINPSRRDGDAAAVGPRHVTYSQWLSVLLFGC